jgi:hypothetical protein
MENLLEDLIGLGVLGPLSKYGSDLSTVSEITSNCQAKRGNRAYLDPVTDCMYIYLCKWICPPLFTLDTLSRIPHQNDVSNQSRRQRD